MQTSLRTVLIALTSALLLAACGNEKADLADHIREGAPPECTVYAPDESQNAIEINCPSVSFVPAMAGRVEAACDDIRRLGIADVKYVFSDHAPVAIGAAGIAAGCHAPVL